MITDQHLNTGAMALGALPAEEAALFVEHLENCPECTAELNGFLETASALGGSVAQTPPASLRRSVMAAVAQTPQLPPLTIGDSALGRHRHSAQEAAAEAAAAEAAAAEAAAAGSAAAARPVVASPVVASAVAARTVPIDTVAASPGVNLHVDDLRTEKLADVIPIRRSWYRRPQALLAAAVAVLVIGGGTTLVVSQQSNGTPNVASCLAAASDKSTISPTVGTGGDVMLSPSCDTAVVKLPRMPDPPTGMVYQLWVIKGSGVAGSTASIGVLKKNSDGTFSEVNAKVHAGDTAVGVTMEPGPSGSAKPTSAPLWVVPLTA